MLDSEKFNKNLSKYNSNAFIQKKIAAELLKILEKSVGDSFSKIFEIGCGSGFLTKGIVKNLKYQTFIANDITENSKKYIKQFECEFYCGDAEKIKFQNDFDLIISSSVFQWFKDLDGFFNKVYNSLKNGGILAFSMFTKDNFKEINDFLGISLNYFDNDDILQKLNKKFDVIFSDTKKNILNFKSPIDILKHIKNTGVNAINKERLTKNNIYDFINSDILNLTYSYNFIVVRKNELF